MRRPRTILCGVAVITAVLGTGLARIEIDTSFQSFVRPETRELVETIEDDFAEGSYVTLVFESRGARSLLEPEMLHQQLRIIRAIGERHAVTTFSLVEGIDRGLRRVKRQSLFDVDDYSTIAEAILGLAGGRTVRDLEKVSAHFLSHPEAIAFYRNLRVAQATGALAAPGAPESRYAVPAVRAIKALVRTDPGETRRERRLLQAAIRETATGLQTGELRVHVLSDELVAYDIDRDTQRSAVLLGTMVFLVDVLCVTLLFRRVDEVVIAFTILVVGSVWTFGAAALVGVKLSFLHLLAFPILLGTGIDDALIFGRRFREELASGRDREGAVRAAWGGVGNAILLTTVTTFAAFLATGLTAAAETFASFFHLVSVSMLVILLVTILLEGPLRAVWPVGAASREGGAEPRHRPGLLEAASVGLARLAARGVRRGPVPVLVGCGVLAALALASATRLDSEMARRDLLQPSMPTWRANEAMQRHFGDFRVGYVLFTGEVEQPDLLLGLRELERRLAAHEHVEQILGEANVDSVTRLLEKLRVEITPETDVRAALERVRASERTADYAVDMSFREAIDYVAHRSGAAYDGLLLRFFVPGEEGSRSIAAVRAIRREIEALGLDAVPGVRVRVGGGDVIYPLESVYYAETMIRSFFLSLVANLAVLLVMWRRLRLALLAMAPLVLATGLVIGSMPLFGVALNPLNLGIGAIIVGLGIDYPIHLIERYDEERRQRGRATSEAIGVSLVTMGPHMLAGMLTTAVGFCASCVLLLPMSTSFGLLTGAAVVLVYLATLFVLPPLLASGRGGVGASRDASR